MTDPLDDAAERWRATQAPPPEVDLARMTASVDRRRRTWVPLTAAASTLALAATGVVLSQRDPQRPIAQGFVLTGNVLPAASGSITAADVAAGQTALGLDLMARRCEADPHANDVLSPASLALALGMLSTGARGSTREAVEELLHTPDGGDGLVAAQRELSTGLATLRQVEVSNHVYTQRGVVPDADVLDELATSYDADLRVLDFVDDPQGSVDKIDAQVAKDTRGLIPGLFGSPLPPNTTTVLTNALYLKADWLTAFKDARPQAFRAASGRRVEVAMMQGQGLSGQYRRTGQWASVTLPYTGGELEAVVLIPTDEAAPPCTLPTADDVAALTTGTSLGGAGLTLPELDLAQTSSLTDDLIALGLPRGGDYSGFGVDDAAVDRVVQKTVLKVDEKGTEAAAVTGVVTTTLSARAHPVIQADQPFLLLIRDTRAGTPLFLAHVNDPTVKTRK